MMIPRQGDIYTASGEFDKMAWLVEKTVVVVRAGHVDGHHTRKVSRPFRSGEVVVITGGHDMDSFEVSFVNPLLILKDVFG